MQNHMHPMKRGDRIAVYYVAHGCPGIVGKRKICIVDYIYGAVIGIRDLEYSPDYISYVHVKSVRKLKKKQKR